MTQYIHFYNLIFKSIIYAHYVFKNNAKVKVATVERIMQNNRDLIGNKNRFLSFVQKDTD